MPLPTWRAVDVTAAPVARADSGTSRSPAAVSAGNASPCPIPVTTSPAKIGHQYGLCSPVRHHSPAPPPVSSSPVVSTARSPNRGISRPESAAALATAMLTGSTPRPEAAADIPRTFWR